VNQVSLTAGVAEGVGWCVHSGQQSPRDCKVERNVNILNNKKLFSRLNNFQNTEKNNGKFNKYL
jgi:hypothetical protein